MNVFWLILSAGAFGLARLVIAAFECAAKAGRAFRLSDSAGNR